MGKDSEGSFRSHANYVRAFARLAGFTVTADRSAVLSELADKTTATSVVANATEIKGIDLEQVRKSLVNAWGTELLLGLAEEYASEKELVSMANNWGVVQTYYVAYHATQALAVARGAQRPDSHPKTQRIFATHWVNSAFRIPPWSLAADADGIRNLPEGRTIDEKIHPWSACTRDSCWDLASLALRTTRRDALPDAVRKARERKRKAKRDAWQIEERDRVLKGRKPRKTPSVPLPQLTKGERDQAEREVRAMSLIDYLYRLRVKANYEDAVMFLEGPTSEYESKQVLHDLRDLISSMMLVHELVIRKCVGTGRMAKLVDVWLASNFPSGFGGALQSRRHLLS